MTGWSDTIEEQIELLANNIEIIKMVIEKKYGKRIDELLEEKDKEEDDGKSTKRKFFED